ncbi:type IV pilin protein [Variovorax saccharolyticus]|uniref:type IV pilin protein n=1 Tax=Variovorax saccharolyticus TaxID=3053516 RepID=UPI002577A0F3|nr:type IV pilin protein [Variovorax sp. J22R187]MDM0019954.1 type IV pilin protein [Variovorax sp. J22R187]
MSSTRRHRTGARGFTLIELMIVVAVIAILAAIAYPAYTDSVVKGKRAQARTALLDLMQQQERYMTQNNTYLKFAASADGSATFKVFSGDNDASPAYWLTAVECEKAGGGNFGMNECVKLVATPTHTDAAVTSLSLTSSGVKECTGTAVTNNNKKLCWP